MSYQLIHTSSLHLLDSHTSGYGTVARSQMLPRALCNKLTDLSVYREPRMRAATVGPQFSYHIIDHAGAAWHVLTCTQQAGADYSGRGCHISHHLVLTQQEIATLLESDSRPTPAGVTLALLKNGFWKNQWKEEPGFITEEPRLKAGDLPDAATQPVWKQLTGHKSNARAFYTAPYNRECLVEISAGTPSHLVLSLLHESDWLTQSHGWGKTYTTETDENDTYTETLRMVCAEGSPLVQKSIRTGHPVLKVAMGMELPLPPEPSANMQSSAAMVAPILTRTLSRSVSHYHYTEEPDWVLYDVRHPASRRTIASCAAAVVLCLGGAVAGWNACTSDSAPQASTLPVAEPGQQGINQEAFYKRLEQLQGLLHAPYNHEETTTLLQQLSTAPENTAEDTLLQECAMLIQNSLLGSTNHAVSIKRLCECARLLQIKDTELVQLYLRFGLHDAGADQWREHFAGAELTDWIHLKQTEPQILDILEELAIPPHTPAADGEDKTPILATTDPLPAEEPEQPEEEIDTPGRISLIPSPAVGGNPLPAALEALIPKLPCSISSGQYIISPFAVGDTLQPAQKLELSPKGFRLYIAAGSKAGEFSIRPEHVNGNPAPLPEVTFSVRNGKLRHVRCGDSDAVVSFPVPAKDDFLTNIILIPAFAVPIPSADPIQLPPAAAAGLEITPADLEITLPSAGKPVATLKLKKNKKFPWVLTANEKKRIRFSIQLPVLTAHNSVKELKSAHGYYFWKGATVTKETELLSSVLCEVEQRSQLPERLARCFEQVVNAPCCGEGKQRNESACIAQLYYIACALANDKLSKREANHLYQAYFQLFADKQFNPVLNRLFAQDAALRLTPEEATQKTLRCQDTRNRIKSLLNTRQARELIRQRICELITRSLMAAYTQEQKALEDEQTRKALFTLRNISVGNHVELLWKFRIEYASEKS